MKVVKTRTNLFMFGSTIKERPVKKKPVKVVESIFEFDSSELSVTEINCLETEFEGCCGAYILYGFTEEDEDGVGIIRDLKVDWEEQVSDWQYEDDWKRLEKIKGRVRPKVPSDKFFKDIYIKELTGYVSREIRSGKIGTVILNEHQVWFAKALTDNGFRLVSDRVRNNNTGNRLYFYIRDPLNPKGKKVITKRFGR